MKKIYCAPETMVVRVSIPRLLAGSPEPQPDEPESKKNNFGFDDDASAFDWNSAKHRDLWSEEEE